MLLVCAALGVGCGSESGASGTPGRFVFVSSPDLSLGNQKLYTAESDGTDRRPLAPSSEPRAHGLPSEPEWSPDGKQIAYERFTDCPKRGDEIPSSCFAIWTIKADGTSARRVIGPSLEFDYYAPTWSPDGGRIAYVRLEVDSENQDLWVIEADGSNERRLTTFGSVYDPSWSPDGERIAFSGYAPDRSFPESDVYAVEASGGVAHKLTQTATHGEEAPDWSPDGERIAYERLIPRRDVTAYQIWVMDADGTNQRIVSEPDANFDLHPVWSADGKQIAYHSERDDDNAIWVVSADGDSRHRKIVGGLIDPEFDWAVRAEPD